MSEQYLETLYKDFEIKLNSISTYLKRISDTTGNLNQLSKEWTYDLKKKFLLVQKYNSTKPKIAPSTHFSIELPPEVNQEFTKAEKEIKQVDLTINNNSEQINYTFQKANRDIKFLVQSYQDLQDIINKIYETYSEIIEIEQD
jgi:chromosome segregation ATPase